MNDNKFERLRLFVPCSRRPRNISVDHEWINNPNDGSFSNAFSFGTVDELGKARIDAALGALILYCDFDLIEGLNRAIDIAKSLREQGALAVRVEQSKIGWEMDRWIELVSSNNPRDLHMAVVVMLTYNDFIQSCGMHAFSLPDTRVAVDDNHNEMIELITRINTYQISEDPIILSGHTFTSEYILPKRILDRWPDNNYSSSDICHNPYGVWRVGPPGGQGKQTSELIPVFIPALITILTAMEKKDGYQLTKDEVEKIRDEASCIAINPRDAQKLEKSRGYSDLNPDLAWEQWQIFRALELTNE